MCYNQGVTESVDSRSFIEEIEKELNAGYGFVPFVGAGFSVPAGIPTIPEIQRYLTRCICLAFGIDVGDNPANSLYVEPQKTWNPTTDDWPSMWDAKRNLPQIDWSAKIRTRILDIESWQENEREADPNKQIRFEELKFLREGEGASYDWRSALIFLSRLHRDSRSSPIKTVSPRPEMTDACFRNLYAGKKPALCHKMLASLANVLRIDLVLTTNFDELIEESFGNSRKPLTVFDVPSNGSLPDAELLKGTRAIIKLHGSRAYIRADYSTDTPPTQEDKARFAEYLTGDSYIGAQFGRHLLVVGCAGQDGRIEGLLKFVGDRSTPGHPVRIFWIAYSHADEDRAKKLSERITGVDFIITRQSQAGLLLLELYQKIRRTIPSLGVMFPSPARLTTPPAPKGTPNENDEIWVKTETFLKDNEDDEKPLLLLAPKDTSGLTSAVTKFFEKREVWSDRVCLWIDMNDISCPDHLFEVILEAVHYRLGIEDWIPAAYLSGSADSKLKAEEIARLVKPTGKTWFIYINCREKPGANISPDDKSPNGWLSKQSKWKLFSGLMKHIHKAGIRIIVMATKNDNDRGKGNRLDKKNFKSEEFDLPSQPDRLEAAINWFSQGSEDERFSRQRFLFSLSLMQRPRLLSTIWTDAGIGASNFDPYHWVVSLEKLGLIRWKPGGMIWIHATLRNAIRDELAKDEYQLSQAGIHENLANWYEKIAIASEAPYAIFESVHHFIESAKANIGTDQDNRAIAMLNHASWVLNSRSFLVQTNSFASGSCRKLEIMIERVASLLPDNPSVVEAACRLQAECLATMRAIAREAGSDKKSFLRHRLWLLIWLQHNWSDAKDKGQLSYWISRDHQDSLNDLRIDPDMALWFVRWSRWKAMLYLSSRMYSQAQQECLRFLDHANYEIPASLEFLRLTEIFVDSHIQSAGVNLRLLKRGYPRMEDRFSYSLETAKRYVENGIIHSHCVRRQVQGGASRIVNNTLARLYIHRSILRSLIEKRSEEFRGTSLGDLENAEGLVREGDPDRLLPEIAIIELHRAEVGLMRSGSTICRMGPGGNPIRVSDWIRLQDKPKPRDDDRSDIQRAYSLACDAMRHLDRAAPILRERRRNVWWTTLYFERRLRAFALQLWTTAGIFGTELPGINLQTMISGDESEIDWILHSAIRMIRVDSYRLATIVDAYASCRDAVLYRQNSGERNEFLNTVINRMNQNLSAALAQLAKVDGSRHDVDGICYPQDDSVRQYVKCIMETCGVRD